MRAALGLHSETCRPLRGMLRTLAVAGGGDRHDAQLVVGQLVDRRIVLAIPVRVTVSCNPKPTKCKALGCELGTQQSDWDAPDAHVLVHTAGDDPVRLLGPRDRPDAVRMGCADGKAFTACRPTLVSAVGVNDQG